MDVVKQSTKKQKRYIYNADFPMKSSTTDTKSGAVQYQQHKVLFL
jgi:hypothetical protein